jgi:UDP-N-acetylmuramoylalanine--D-glutamate ligase
MISPINGLRNYHITLLGLGVENRALAHFLQERDLSFSVCDGRGPDDFDDFKREYGDAIREWHLGPAYLDSLDRFDLIFRTPGISPLQPELQRAQSRGTRISSQTRLFAALSPAPLLGVTGTKGKGTTSSLIAAMLHDGPHRQIFVAGNIGQPPIAFLDALSNRDLVILELSSFQLLDWEASPHIAVALNVTRDHLDYHANLDEYIAAKRNIARFQKADDWLISDRDCSTARTFADNSHARQLSFSAVAEVEAGAWVSADHLWLRRPDADAEPICTLAEIPLQGRHNWSNAAAAAAAAIAAGATTEQIAAGIRRFRGLPHRLERIGTFDGITCYDDSLATTPDAAVAAIRAFDQPLVLIAGGSSKRADFAELGRTIVDGAVRAVILIGAEADRIKTAIHVSGNFTGDIDDTCNSMQAAVAAARRRAQAGDVILLSPACASFGMFANYIDRGNQFRRAVMQKEGKDPSRN